MKKKRVAMFGLLYATLFLFSSLTFAQEIRWYAASAFGNELFTGALSTDQAYARDTLVPNILPASYDWEYQSIMRTWFYVPPNTACPNGNSTTVSLNYYPSGWGFEQNSGYYCDTTANGYRVAVKIISQLFDDACSCLDESSCLLEARSAFPICWPSGPLGSLAAGYTFDYAYDPPLVETDCANYVAQCTDNCTLNPELPECQNTGSSSGGSSSGGSSSGGSSGGGSSGGNTVTGNVEGTFTGTVTGDGTTTGDTNVTVDNLTEVAVTVDMDTLGLENRLDAIIGSTTDTANSINDFNNYSNGEAQNDVNSLAIAETNAFNTIDSAVQNFLDNYIQFNEPVTIDQTISNLLPVGVNCQNPSFDFGHDIIFTFDTCQFSSVKSIIGWLMYIYTAWFLFSLITSVGRESV